MHISPFRLDPVMAAASVVVIAAGTVVGFGLLAAMVAIVLIALPSGWQGWCGYAEEHLGLPPKGSPERAVALRARRAVRLIGSLAAAKNAAVLPQRGREVREEAMLVVATVETLVRQSVAIKLVCLQLAGSTSEDQMSQSSGTELAAVGRELLERARALTAGIENVAANVARLVVVQATGAVAPEAGMARIAGEIDSLRVALQEAQEYGRHAAALKLLEV